jgi:hypothetical protein
MAPFNRIAVLLLLLLIGLPLMGRIPLRLRRGILLITTIHSLVITMVLMIERAKPSLCRRGGHPGLPESLLLGEVRLEMENRARMAVS